MNLCEGLFNLLGFFSVKMFVIFSHSFTISDHNGAHILHSFWLTYNNRLPTERSVFRHKDALNLESQSSANTAIVITCVVRGTDVLACAREEQCLVLVSSI